MLNYDNNLKTFIQILEVYGIIKDYKLMPNGIELYYGLDKINIIFEKEGKGIDTINEYHTELSKYNKQDIINILNGLEKNDYI